MWSIPRKVVEFSESPPPIRGALLLQKYNIFEDYPSFYSKIPLYSHKIERTVPFHLEYPRRGCFFSPFSSNYRKRLCNFAL